MPAKITSYHFYRSLLKAIKRQIREVQGAEPKSLRHYYRHYASEIESSSPNRITAAEVFSQLLESKLILVGDFHTLDQAQKQFLKILQELRRLGAQPMVGLEMIPSRHDKILQRYLSGELDEEGFLKGIRYFKQWGFDFGHYRPLLAYLRDEQIPTHGIDGVENRDEFMAGRIQHWLNREQNRPMLVLVGDLHLCKSHMPSYLRAAGIEPTVVLQNSETIQMKKMRLGEQPTGWWDLGEGRYLINNTKPWVKMQTYLTWLEHGGEALGSVYNYCITTDLEEDVDLSETVYQYVCILKKLFGLFLREDNDFCVYTLNSIEFLNAPYFKEEPGRTYASYIKDGRSVYLAWRNTIYIPVLDVNRTVQEAAHYLMGRNISTDIGRAAFFDRIHYFASGYLASKLVNPLRRTRTPEQMKQFIQQYESLGAKEKVYLVQQRTVYQEVLEFLTLLDSGEEFRPSYLFHLTEVDQKLFFAISESVGRLMGELTFQLYDMEHLTGGDLKRFVFLQRNPFLFYRLRHTLQEPLF